MAVEGGPQIRTKLNNRRLALDVGAQPLTVAVGMAAVIFAFRMAIDNPSNGLSLLYVIPIVLVTAAYGSSAGAAAAAVAGGLVFLWADLTTVDLGAVALAMRVLAFFAVPAVL